MVTSGAGCGQSDCRPAMVKRSFDQTPTIGKLYDQATAAQLTGVCVGVFSKKSRECRLRRALR